MGGFAKLRAWVALSRPPFHLVGVLPFGLGTVLAHRLDGLFRWDVFILGTLGVVAIMLATYFAGEYWDYREDTIGGGSSRFAGGSQVIQRGLLPHRAALRAALASLGGAGAIGLVLQFGYQTGPWTIPFGTMGMLGGFFYSATPVRWVSRGWGELWIAFCYGWLPVATGYYLQVGRVNSLVHWLAAPIGLTIFNVILLNEFPDHPADLAAGKRNLAVRLGLRKATAIYDVAAMASWATMLFSLTRGIPILALWVYLPFLALSLGLVILVSMGQWRDRVKLERLCGANLVVNLGTTLAYIVAFSGA